MLYRVSEVVYINFMLLCNIGITFLDQSVYSNATTYIMVVLAIAVLSISTTRTLIAAYVFSFVVFTIFLPYFQVSEQIRYAELVNSFVTILVSVLIILITNNNKKKNLV